MKARKPISTHQLLVWKIINAIEDRDVQEQLLIVSNQYQKALSGLSLAVTKLREIDETCGTEHSEIIGELISVISQTKESQISLLDMTAHYTNDCVIGA